MNRCISLLFPCSSLFRILPFRQMPSFILTFLQILAVAPPPLQGFTGRGRANPRRRSPVRDLGQTNPSPHNPARTAVAEQTQAGSWFWTNASALRRVSKQSSTSRANLRLGTPSRIQSARNDASRSVVGALSSRERPLPAIEPSWPRSDGVAPFRRSLRCKRQHPTPQRRTF